MNDALKDRLEELEARCKAFDNWLGEIITWAEETDDVGEKTVALLRDVQTHFQENVQP